MRSLQQMEYLVKDQYVVTEKRSWTMVIVKLVYHTMHWMMIKLVVSNLHVMKDKRFQRKVNVNNATISKFLLAKLNVACQSVDQETRF